MSEQERNPYEESANDRTMTCGHTPEDCDCDPTPEQEATAAHDEAYWDGHGSCYDEPEEPNGSCDNCGCDIFDHWGELCYQCQWWQEQT